MDSIPLNHVTLLRPRLQISASSSWKCLASCISDSAQQVLIGIMFPVGPDGHSSGLGQRGRESQNLTKLSKLKTC